MTQRRLPLLRRAAAASFADLGMSPLSNAFLDAGRRSSRMEPFYPLHACVCEKCFLVQLEEFETARAASSRDYAYFSSYSESWLAHASGLHRGDDRRASAWAPRASWSRSRATTAICCSTSSRRAFRCSASSRRRTSPRRPRRRACRRWSSSSARRPPTSSRPRGGKADLIARQQRAGARARPQRLRRAA